MEDAVVSLEAPGTDWTSLVRFVERSGRPLWLEAEGQIYGVLLPTDQARRLMGKCTVQSKPEGLVYNKGLEANIQEEPFAEE
jgi:hypothetical protein